MGSTDKIIRVMISILLVVLFATDVITGTLGWVIIGIAAIFTLTSFVGFCPLYTIFGISSKKN
jgi:hypothetical protein